MNKLEGREVQAFLPIDWNSEGLVAVKSKFKGNFVYKDEFMGDHSEHYILEHDNSGKEIARWNVRDISWIQWKEKDF